MASLSRRISSVLLATAMVASLAEPALAQVSPGAATVGPAGGTPSTTAPSNNEGTPSGGSGVIGQTRTGPGGGGFNDGRIVLNPQAAEPAPVARRPVRAQRRAVSAQQRRRPAARAPQVPNRAGGATDPAGIGAGSSAGLNGSNAQSR